MKGRTHELKIERQYFEAIATGQKTYEIRENDRAFQAGDSVVLRELREAKTIAATHAMLFGNIYSGRKIWADIGFVSDYQQHDSYVVFSLLNVVAQLDTNEVSNE